MLCVPLRKRVTVSAFLGISYLNAMKCVSGRSTGKALIKKYIGQLVVHPSVV